jgi:hypothetical protein
VRVANGLDAAADWHQTAEIFFSATFSLPKKKLPFPASSSTASSKPANPRPKKRSNSSPATATSKKAWAASWP